MNPQFARQIEALCQQIRRRLILRALSLSLIVVIGVSFSLGGLDYLLRFQERGLRFLATGALLATVIWCFVRIAKPALRMSIDKVALARWLEKLGNKPPVSLAAACDLMSLPEEDVRWGSPELRRLTIEQVEKCWKTPHRHEVIARSPGLWPGYLAAIFSLVVVVLILARPVLVGTAVIRLLNPLSSVSYPQKTHLIVSHYPEKLSRGDTFFVQVSEERGQLPDEVRIIMRSLEDETRVTTSQPMRRVRHQFIFRQENTKASFEFQVIGGDDRNQPWRRVEVVDPPQVTDLKVTLVPPEYTGWPPEEIQGPIRALAGTKVRLFGRANRPLKRVLVDCGTDGGFEADVLPDRHSFRFPTDNGGLPQKRQWIIQNAGYYRIRLEAADATFSVNEPRWEVRVSQDGPPVVTLESGQRLLQMTQDGSFPLRVTARDDLAIKEVAIICTDMNGNNYGQPIQLYRGPEFPRLRVRMSELETHADSMQSDYVLQLPVVARREGLIVRVLARVEDYKGQSSESEPLELQVVSQVELSEKLTAEEEKILGQLGDLYGSFRRVRDDWERLSETLRTDNRLSRTQANQLLTLDSTQRQAFRRIADPNTGVIRNLEDLANTAERNKMREDRINRLRNLHSHLESSWKQHGVPAESHLGLIANWARSMVERLSGDDQSLNIEKEWRDISEAARELSIHQTAWEQSLASLLQDVSGVFLANNFRRELERLLVQQMELTRQSRELSRQTLGRALQELNPAEQQSLVRLSGSQSQLAARLEELVGETLGKLAADGSPGGLDSVSEKLEETPERTPYDSPDRTGNSGKPDDRIAQPNDETHQQAATSKESELIQLVIDRINNQGLSALMRQASFVIGQNRLSEAVTLQEQCETILKELIDLLDGKEADREQVTQVLDRLGKELQSLVETQEQLIREFAKRHQAGQPEEAFSSFIPQQTDVEKRTQKLLEDASGLARGEVKSLLEQAIQAMQAARATAQERNAAQTTRNAELAQRMMRQALERVNQEQLSHEQRKNFEKWQTVLQEVGELIGAQRDIFRKTQSLDIERQKARNKEPAQSWKDSVVILAKSQEAVGEGVAQLEKELQDAPVITAILGRVQQPLQEATQHLSVFDCGKSTQEAQQAVLRDLQVIAAALRGDDKLPPQSAAEQTSETTSPDNQRSQIPGQVFLAAQVRLLRELQASINRRTETLEELRAEGGENQTSFEEESKRLSQEQAMVLDLAARLHDQVARSATTGKNEPDELQKPSPEAGSRESGRPESGSPRPWQPGSVEDLFAPK